MNRNTEQKNNPLNKASEWGAPSIEGDAELKILLGRIVDQLGTGAGSGAGSAGAISDLKARLAGITGKAETLRADGEAAPAIAQGGGHGDTDRVNQVYQSVAARYSEVAAQPILDPRSDRARFDGQWDSEAQPDGRRDRRDRGDHWPG